MGQHSVTTGMMLGGSGAGYTARWFYISTDAGTSWQPTYTGWGESAAQGKLMNLRMIQAIWADAGSAFPGFDPASNTSAFIAELPSYKALGMLAATVGLQGGGIGVTFTEGDATAFNDDGTAILGGGTFAAPGAGTWWARLQDVIEAMDDLGMVCIVNIFYFGQDGHLSGDEACREAVRQTAAFLIANDYRNVIVDLVNEWTGVGLDHAILSTNAGIAELLGILSGEFSGLDWRPPATASAAGIGEFSGLTGAMAAASDILMPHGNERTIAEVTDGMAWHVANFSGPILMNEDHPPGGGSYDDTLEVNATNRDDDIGKMQAAFNAPGSWGGMFFGYHQAMVFQWPAGASDDISGGSEANYVRAVMDGMSLLTGAAPSREYTAYSNTANATTQAEGVTLTGSAAGTATATGTLTVREYTAYSNTASATTQTGATPVALDGTSTGAAAATGSLAVARLLSATAAAGATVTGDLTVTTHIALDATAAGTATGTGTLAVARALSGTSTGSATVAGELSVTGLVALDGASVGSSTATAALSAAKPLAGTSEGTATVTGSLDVSGAIDLSGSATGGATATAALSVRKPLNATSSGQATATGVVIVRRGLTAVAIGQAVVDGELTVLSPATDLTGTSSGSATVSATLAVGRGLTGTSDGAAGLDGSLSVARGLTASAAGVATLTGTLLVGSEAIPTDMVTPGRVVLLNDGRTRAETTSGLTSAALTSDGRTKAVHNG